MSYETISSTAQFLTVQSLPYKFFKFSNPQHQTSITISPAITVIKMLISVPASTYSVFAVSFSPKRMMNFAATRKPNYLIFRYLPII